MAPVVAGAIVFFCHLCPLFLLGGLAFESAQGLLSSANQGKAPMQKVILVQDHVLVLHPLIVQVETTRLDGLPGLGYRFEKACTNSGLRYALSNLSGGEDPTTVGSLHLEAVQGVRSW